MVQLQKPPFVYMGGKLTAWDDARIHVGAEAITRSISVLEGIKGYWSHDNETLSLLALRAHYDRLKRSALLQYVPFEHSYEEFAKACFILTRKLISRERDLWLRTTVLAIDGYWGQDTVSDLVITCYHQDRKPPGKIKLGFSSWQRPLDNSLPARIKSAANYQIGRMARIEGRRQGLDDMILLNTWGRVAEATASCVLMVRDGGVVTPPASEGCLESITINIVEAMCKSLGIPFARRPIDRTELLVADEIALVGTLMEMGVVSVLDHRAMPTQTPVLDPLVREFWACVRAERQHPAVVLTPV